MISNQAFSYFDYKPDYFKYINFPELFHVKNENIIVTVIDSEIANIEELNLIGKEYYISSNYKKSKEKDDAFNLHGTAMASIIGSKQFRGREEAYVGIFPSVKIINRIAMPNSGYPLSILEAASDAIFSENEFIINISGADIGTKNANDWNDLLNKDHEVKIANGTSESAAIVSGVIAIMKSCMPDANASFIKSILLETADSYEHLKEYITDGKILNAGKAIETVCKNEKEIIHANINNDNQFKSKIIFKHDLNKNEYFESPVTWKIKISNNSYNNFFLTDLDGLNHYQPKFEVSAKDDNIEYYLSESGQIITKSGNRDSMPLCLTASDLNESSWQHVGFLPCSKSYENYQKWDLNFISEKTRGCPT